MPNYAISGQGVSSLEYMPIGRRGELDDKINYLPLDNPQTWWLENHIVGTLHSANPAISLHNR